MENKPTTQTSATIAQKNSNLPESGIQFTLPFGTELIIEIIKLNQRIKSVYVGKDDNNFLILKLSPNDLIGTFKSEVVVKSPIAVKFQYKDAIYGFNTEILNIISNPCKLVFMAFPKKIEEFKIRPNLRHECNLTALAMLNNELIDMVIVDINKEGCQSVIKMPSGIKREVLCNLIHVDTILEIITQFTGAERIRFVGRVRNISKDVDRIRIGMSFEELSPEVRTKIDVFISAIQKGA